MLVVYSVARDINGEVDGIWYAHSFNTAHTGYIIINDENADFISKSNIWNDSAMSDSYNKGRY